MSDKPSVWSPWFWVPSLYFARNTLCRGDDRLCPYVYKRLGVSNTDIALLYELAESALGDQTFGVLLWIC